MSCRALASHTVLPGSHQITTRWAERWRLANRQLTAQKPRFVCANWHFKSRRSLQKPAYPGTWIR